MCETVPDQRLRRPHHGVERAAARVPPLGGPVERTQHHHPGRHRVQVGPQQPGVVRVLQQLAPHVAVLGRLGRVPDRDVLRDLARVADRGGGVVRDLQAVPQVRLDRRVDAVQRVRVRRQGGQDPGHVLAYVRDARPHDLLDQVVTRREVVIDGRCLDLRLVGDVAQPRARVPFPAEHVRGGIEDPFPGPRGLGTGVLRRRHLRFSRHESNYRLPALPAPPSALAAAPRSPPTPDAPARPGRPAQAQNRPQRRYQRRMLLPRNRKHERVPCWPEIRGLQCLLAATRRPLA